MDLSQIASLLADGSFGGGFGAGFGSGFAAGIGAGIGVGTSSGCNNGKQQFKRQLTAAIEAGEIGLFDREGNALTADALGELLDQKFKES